MIGDNIRVIRGRIASVCSRLKKPQDAVTLVAVTKERSPEEIREAIAAGITDIGENRVQEALVKYKKLSAVSSQLSAVKWHFVGHLQTNKVRETVEIFDLIHSVDSVKLAAAIEKEAARINKIQDILIQVNTSFEGTKFGVRPGDLIPVVLELLRLEHVRVKGLMTIAPIVDNPEKIRPYFRKLKELLNEVNAVRGTQYAGPILSMGMTDDFEVAIEEGATLVRIGRGIFMS